MNTALRSILIVLSACLFATCQKDFSFNTEDILIFPPSSDITATVTGRVIDGFGDPVKGVTISVGPMVTVTDINGEFILKQAPLKSDAAFIKAQAAGYFPASRTFRAKQDQKYFIEIELIPKMPVGNINSSSGGTINLGNGSAITLPSNGVVIESTGAAYNGIVSVSMAWIDPAKPSMFRQMPGDLRGIDALNNEQSFQSYGMLAVELNGVSGEKLQLAAGKSASLQFPIPASLTSSAPAIIALWSFNESTGLWKQEGTASKNGNNYIANVSHFSYWSCDIPFSNAANFSATLIDQTGQPLKYVHVYISSVTTGHYTGAHGIPDSSGYIVGRVPAGEALILQVQTTSICQMNILVKNIGPFQAGSNNSLGNVMVTAPGPFVKTITGMAVDCSGNPVTNGYAEVKAPYRTYRANITAGTFSITFSDCGGPATATYFVADNATSKQSNPVITTISTANTNIGTVTACSISSQQFINYILDGTSYSLTSPPDSLTAQVGVWGPLFLVGFNSTSTIQFGIDATGIGTFPLNKINIGGPSITDSVRVSAASPINVNITEFGSVGGYITGNYSGSLAGISSPNHTIQCSFRVRRAF